MVKWRGAKETNGELKAVHKIPDPNVTVWWPAGDTEYKVLTQPSNSVLLRTWKLIQKLHHFLHWLLCSELWVKLSLNNANISHPHKMTKVYTCSCKIFFLMYCYIVKHLNSNSAGLHTPPELLLRCCFYIEGVLIHCFKQNVIRTQKKYQQSNNMQKSTWLTTDQHGRQHNCGS